MASFGIHCRDDPVLGGAVEDPRRPVFVAGFDVLTCNQSRQSNRVGGLVVEIDIGDGKADADRFMATVQADLIRGAWTDPRLSMTTLAEWSQRWLVTKTHLKPKTLAGYRSNLDAHVLPVFGDYQLRHIDRMATEEWIANLQASGLGPSGVRQARQILNAMLTLAVDAG